MNGNRGRFVSWKNFRINPFLRCSIYYTSTVYREGNLNVNSGHVVASRWNGQCFIYLGKNRENSENAGLLFVLFGLEAIISIRVACRNGKCAVKIEFCNCVLVILGHHAKSSSPWLKPAPPHPFCIISEWLNRGENEDVRLIFKHHPINQRRWYKPCTFQQRWRTVCCLMKCLIFSVFRLINICPSPNMDSKCHSLWPTLISVNAVRVLIYLFRWKNTFYTSSEYRLIQFQQLNVEQQTLCLYL